MRLLPLLILAVAVQAQNSTDVHITPDPQQPAPAISSAAPDVAPAITTDPPAEFNTRTHALHVDVDLVLVPVTITDAMDHPITGLQKQDFALYEDDQQQQIRYFSAEDAPLSLGVLLDLSGSMTNKIALAREAVAEFFKSANPQDDYFVVTFADRPTLLADSTSSVGFIQGKLAAVKPRGHTALLDAIYLGVRKAHQARYQRRALLIISDGGDNHSRYRAKEIKEMVQEADVEIYAIGIFDSVFRTPEEWYGKRLLTQVTEATGGRTVTLDNAARLPQVAAQISLELRNQYVLGYHSARPERDGRWRRIRVKLTQAATAARQIYSKRGYLAPGE